MGEEIQCGCKRGGGESHSIALMVMSVELNTITWEKRCGYNTGL